MAVLSSTAFLEQQVITIEDSSSRLGEKVQVEQGRAPRSNDISRDLNSNASSIPIVVEDEIKWDYFEIEDAKKNEVKIPKELSSLFNHQTSLAVDILADRLIRVDEIEDTPLHSIAVCSKKWSLFLDFIRGLSLVSKISQGILVRALAHGLSQVNGIRNTPLHCLALDSKRWSLFLEFIQEKSLPIFLRNSLIEVLINDLGVVKNNFDDRPLSFIVDDPKRLNVFLQLIRNKKVVSKNLREGLIGVVIGDSKKLDKKGRTSIHYIAQNSKTLQSFLTFIQDKEIVPKLLQDRFIKRLAITLVLVDYDGETPFYGLVKDEKSSQQLIAALRSPQIGPPLVASLEQCLAIRDRRGKRPFEDPLSKDWRERRQRFVDEANKALVSGFRLHQTKLQEVVSQERQDTVPNEIVQLLLEFTAISLPQERGE